MIKNNLTRIDLAKFLSNKTGFSISFSKKLINDLMIVLIDNIKNDKLILKNIGSFKLLKKKERLGRNPKTKEIYSINSRKSLSFTASKKILNSLN